MSVTQFKEYRNEVHEGVTGPTRMEIQKFFDKEKGTQRARLNKTSQHFNIRDVIVNAKGTVVGYKMEEVEVDELHGGPHYAGSRHKKIERDKYRKRKGYAAMTDEKENEARTYMNRKDDDEKKKKKRFAFGGKQDNIRAGGKGYGKHGEEVEMDEEMSPEDIKAAAGPAMEQYNNEMRKNFPEKQFTSHAVTAPLGGGITFVFAVIPTAKAKGVDLLNAPSHSKYMMHLTDGRGETVPASKFSIAQIMGRLPVKFRKITAKTPSDAVKKMTDWFKKNKSEFEGQIKEEVEVDGRKKGYKEALARINSRKAKVEEKKKEKSPVFKGTPRQIRQQMKDWKAKNDKLHIGEEEIEEAKILKKGAKVKVAHPAKGKGMVTGKIVRYDDQGPGSPFYIVDIGEPRSEKVPAHKIKEETEIDEVKSAYDKQIAAFLKKGGKIKKLAVSKKEVAKAAAEFRKSHKNMTQKEIELDLEDELEKQANAEGVIIADEKLFLVTESISEKEYDDLKKGDTVALEYGSAMSGGKAKFKVTAKNVVNKGKVGKVTLKSVAKPNSVKFFLYKRGNKVSAAQGDMGINVKSFRVEEVDIFESQDLQAKMALDDAGIKYSTKNNSITVKKKDLKKAQKAFEKSFKKGGWPTLKVEAVLPEAADRDEVIEFKAFIENDPRLEKQKIIPIVKNIQRRMKAGTYDHKKAPKLWMYLVKDAAKLYAKEFDGMKYSSEVHKEVASQLADDYKAEIEAQDGQMYESKFYAHFKDYGKDEEDTIEELWEAELFEVLKSKDKSVIDAFYDKKPLEGRMLSTDGMTLEKSGMGSQQIAHWVKGKIKITAVSDVKSTEEIVRYMKKSIPSGVFEDRDYRKEYDNYQGKPEQIARRSSRNQARRVMGDKTEEGKDVGHKDNNPMNNDPKNLRNEDPSKNRREPRLRKMESFSDYFNRPFVAESTRNDIYNGSISAGVELEKYAKKSGGIDKDDLLATASILKKGKLPSAKQIPGDTEPRDKVFSIMGKHLSKQYLKKYKGLSPALDSALKEHWELEERKLSDTEVKRREEIAQDLDDADFKKRYGDDWKSVKMGVATNMAKKEAMESVDYVWFEARYKYKIDHKTYTSAVEEALIVADKQGYEVDMDDYFNQIATGPRKPQEGKTNVFKIALEKGGKEQKKKLQIQIYGKGKHGYELNCYIQ